MSGCRGISAAGRTPAGTPGDENARSRSSHRRKRNAGGCSKKERKKEKQAAVLGPALRQHATEGALPLGSAPAETRRTGDAPWTDNKLPTYASPRDASMVESIVKASQLSKPVRFASASLCPHCISLPPSRPRPHMGSPSAVGSLWGAAIADPAATRGMRMRMAAGEARPGSLSPSRVRRLTRQPGLTLMDLTRAQNAGGGDATGTEMRPRDRGRARVRGKMKGIKETENRSRHGNRDRHERGGARGAVMANGDGNGRVCASGRWAAVIVMGMGRRGRTGAAVAREPDCAGRGGGPGDRGRSDGEIECRKREEHERAVHWQEGVAAEERHSRDRGAGEGGARRRRACKTQDAARPLGLADAPRPSRLCLWRLSNSKRGVELERRGPGYVMLQYGIRQRLNFGCGTANERMKEGGRRERLWGAAAREPGRDTHTHGQGCWCGILSLLGMTRRREAARGGADAVKGRRGITMQGGGTCAGGVACNVAAIEDAGAVGRTPGGEAQWMRKASGRGQGLCRQMDGEQQAAHACERRGGGRRAASSAFAFGFASRLVVIVLPAGGSDGLMGVPAPRPRRVGQALVLSRQEGFHLPSPAPSAGNPPSPPSSHGTPATNPNSSANGQPSAATHFDPSNLFLPPFLSIPDPFRKFPAAPDTVSSMDFSDELASLIGSPTEHPQQQSHERSTSHSNGQPNGAYDDYRPPTHNIFDISAPTSHHHHHAQSHHQQPHSPFGPGQGASAFSLPPPSTLSQSHSQQAGPNGLHDFAHTNFNSTLPALGSSMRYEPPPHSPFTLTAPSLSHSHSHAHAHAHAHAHSLGGEPSSFSSHLSSLTALSSFSTITANGPPAGAADILSGPAQAQSPSPALIANEKRRRRRESHNAVERRRRDNINEKISELATLIPECLLDPNATFTMPASLSAPGEDLLFGTGAKGTGAAPSMGADGGSTPPAEKKDGSAEPDEKDGGEQGGIVKANKGMILRKSVEYIRYLQQLVSAQASRNRDLEQQLQVFRTGGDAGAGVGVDGTSGAADEDGALMLHEEVGGDFALGLQQQYGSVGVGRGGRKRFSGFELESVEEMEMDVGEDGDGDGDADQDQDHEMGKSPSADGESVEDEGEEEERGRKGRDGRPVGSLGVKAKPPGPEGLAGVKVKEEGEMETS
ncbi:predicted protein [Postia placenta Mad-698-R]|nr:predicted protein [Postia placenta Mad-698-R]